MCSDFKWEIIFYRNRVQTEIQTETEIESDIEIESEIESEIETEIQTETESESEEGTVRLIDERRDIERKRNVLI